MMSDGFIPFDPGKHTLKPGDRLRFKEATVVSDKGLGHARQIAIVMTGGGREICYLSSIAAVCPTHEPLKVGDVVKHSLWHEGTAEIAGIKDGRAAFWPMEGIGYIPVPRPLSELERVK
jgi:hypothetical protein